MNTNAKHNSIGSRPIAGTPLILALLGFLVCSGPLMAADPYKGEKIYQRNCSFCHGETGRPEMPGIVDFSRGEGLFRSDSALKEHIEAGGNGCPSFSGLIREWEMLDLIAYLRTLR